MNHLQKHFSASLIALAALLSAAPMGALAATAPDLGAAASFAVLSTLTTSPGAVTCTGSTTTTTITGDVGTASSDPLSVTQTNCNIIGSVVTPVLQGVLDGFNNAYTAIQSETITPCTTTFAEDAPGAGNTYTGNLPVLGPLPPGVYCFHTAATFTDTTLTLSGPSNGVWIFKVGIDGTGALTGTNFSVVMANGGDSCNVTWWVAQAATIKKNPAAAAGSGFFQGDILAGAAITMTGVSGSPSSFNGDVLAKAAITMTDVNVTGCNANGGGNGGHCDHGDKGHHYGQYKDHEKCNQGVGNGPEGCDPGNSNLHNPYGSNDEHGGKPGDPGRKGGNK